MRHARPVGLSPDGGHLILVTEEGDHIHVPADERLRAILAGERSRPGPRETVMQNTLTPREIQNRIRSGASIEEVAEVAGMPADKVEPFAAPVLAEREHVAGLAQAAPVRRAGETGSHRQLRRAVQDRLVTRGLDIEDVTWDAWRQADRKWVIQARYRSGGTEHAAQFLYDQRGRFCVAHNDEGVRLLDDGRPQPASRTRHQDPDSEPTVDFNDEFAIVNAVGVEDAAEAFPVVADEPTLTRVNGIYDFAPEEAPGELDRLLGMLRTYSEDSVEIYPGLDVVRPVGGLPPVPEVVVPAPATPEPSPETGPAAEHRPAPPGFQEHPSAQQPAAKTPQPGPAEAAPHAPETPTPAASQPREPQPREPLATPSANAPRAPHLHAVPPLTETVRVSEVSVELTTEVTAEPSEPDADATLPSPEVPVATTKAVKPPRPTRRGRVRAKPDQDPLVAGRLPEPAPAEPEPAVAPEAEVRPKPKKRRASVPTWDEIMFGSPQRPPKK